MDLKYLLCEPVSKLASKAPQPVIIHPNDTFPMEWSPNTSYAENDIWSNNQMSSPKSICSSISTCSSTSSSSSRSYSSLPPSRSTSSFSCPERVTNHNQQQQRRRTASDASLTRQHMFIYSHPQRRTRSESASNNSVQTRTPWTPYEDHLLQQGYDQGLSWAMISSTYLPHRSRGCCWGRFKTLQNKNMIDSSQSHMRHFRRPWKAIDFNNGNKKVSL